MNQNSPFICIIGDTHGHLQLALCVVAQWQKVLGVTFEAVFLCGDVGTFTEDSQLDSTTRRHAKVNPCELEFLNQWSVRPQPYWLARIFASRESDGLGLECPVIMVHGNHEGFTHLARLVSGGFPSDPLAISDLPVVDPEGSIYYLPSGWRCMTTSGVIVGGVGGVEKGQRHAKYHELAYINEAAILHLLEMEPSDILITHQGPAKVQGISGSKNLDFLLEGESCRYWFHGHSTPNMDIGAYGPAGRTTVVPLGDVAFPMKGLNMDDPGDNAWCCFSPGQPDSITRERPEFWRDYRKQKWQEMPNGQLVAPPLNVQ